MQCILILVGYLLGANLSTICANSEIHVVSLLAVYVYMLCRRRSMQELAKLFTAYPPPPTSPISRVLAIGAAIYIHDQTAALTVTVLPFVPT